MATYKDGYVDILDCRRGLSDFKYALKARPDVPGYKYNQPRTPTQLKHDVMNSDRVGYAIEQVTLLHMLLRLGYVQCSRESGMFVTGSR